MLNITEIIVALIGLLAAVLTTIAVPYIRAKLEIVRANLGEAKWERLQGFACITARAAEQMYGAGQGEEKLLYALGRVKAAAAEAGLIYDEATIRAAIEAAVLDINTEY